MACLDTPTQLAPALSSAASLPAAAENGLAGATVVFVTVPRLPGLASRLRHRFGSKGLAAWIAALAEPDAARAVLPALTVAPGTYNVTDGVPVTQALLNARLTAARSRRLHPLNDAGWGSADALFGASREITDATFAEVTGWRPRATPAAEGLAGML